MICKCSSSANILSTFHSSIGGSYTMSLTLHGLVFSCCLVYYMEVVSIVLDTDNPVTSSPF